MRALNNSRGKEGGMEDQVQIELGQPHVLNGHFQIRTLIRETKNNKNIKL